MRSLRFRITVGVVLGQLLVLGLATWLGYQLAARGLTQQFDEALLTRARTALNFVEQEMSLVLVERERMRQLPPTPGEVAEELQIWHEDGRCLYRSESLGEADLPREEVGLGACLVQDGTLSDGTSARLLTTRLGVLHVEKPFWKKDVTYDTAEVILVVARERSRLDSALGVLLGGVLLGDVLILITAAAVAHLVAQRSLRPLDKLGDRVRGLDVATLGALSSDDQPRELQPLLDSLNDLHSRVDDALRREKRLGATIAHEFRTPISELRALAQVALADPDDHEYTRRALEQVDDVSVRLVELLDMIRRMDQLEEFEGDVSRESVALSDFVEEQVTELHASEVDLSGLEEDLTVLANRSALASIVRNLLGNSVLYRTSGSHTRCVAQRNAEVVELSIENPTTDLRPEDVPHLTEPFWRASPARDDRERHGLGLTIARGMCALSGLGLRFQLDGDCFVATVSFPAVLSTSE
ncbi:MAG: ATP-binding protein [Planctomycetota bacterium]|nr:ATP-binding protein [Planctomycetota bacterium]